MAVLNPPGFLQNAGNVHTAEQMRNWQGVLLAGASGATSLVSRGGVNPALGNALVVTQTGSPSMAVVVKSGEATVPGSQGFRQGVYSVLNDADVTLSVTAAHASLPRIDIVAFKVEDQAYSGAVNAASLVVVAGTPASVPAAPAAPANSIVLAQVLVGAGVTSVLNANITDVRPILGGVGGLISVASQTERDSLTAYQSLGVYRRDANVIETYDGAGYRRWSPTYRVRSALGGTAANITFTGIPSTLDVIRVSWSVRSTDAAALLAIYAQVNSDVANNYDNQYIQSVSPSTVSGGSFNAVNYLRMGTITGAGATANYFGAGRGEFVGWSAPHGNQLHTVFESSCYNLGGFFFLEHDAGEYHGAAPFTSLTFFPQAGSFVAGSWIMLEGLYA